MSKGLKTFLTVLIVIVIITGVAVSAYFIGKKGIKIPDKAPENEVEVQQSGLVSPEEVEMNGLKITAKTISAPMYEAYGAPRGAEAALTLTVTPTPADAELTGAKFTIAFKNASSAWATGKTVTEYVTLSQSNEKSATVSCLKAFGEPIVITYTVTGEKGESKSATYQLDYRARIVDSDIRLPNSTYVYQMYDEDQSAIYANFTLSNYTIKETFTVQSVKFELTNEFRSELTQAQLNVGTFDQGGLNDTLNDENGLSYNSPLDSIKTDLLFEETIKTQAFRSACESGEEFEFSITITDGYMTETYTEKFDIDISGFPKAVQSVQFADGSQHTF